MDLRSKSSRSETNVQKTLLSSRARTQKPRRTNDGSGFDARSQLQELRSIRLVFPIPQRGAIPALFVSPNMLKSSYIESNGPQVPPLDRLGHHSCS